jgi:hypothetical protein
MWGMNVMRAFVFRVLTVSLYFVTALVTGLHNFFLLMLIVNGAPLNLLNCAALVGSAVLLVAAVLMSYQSRVAGKIGLLGSLLLWIYYGPLVVITLGMPFTSRAEVQTLISDHDFVPLYGRLLGPILLIACTVHSALCVRSRPKPMISAAVMNK